MTPEQVISEDLWVWLARRNCEATFCKSMALHSGAPLSDVIDLYQRVSSNLHGLTESPQGWAVLSAAMLAEGSVPLIPSVH